jgi:hypothetical protein
MNIGNFECQTFMTKNVSLKTLEVGGGLRYQREPRINKIIDMTRMIVGTPNAKGKQLSWPRQAFSKKRG